MLAMKNDDDKTIAHADAVTDKTSTRRAFRNESKGAAHP